MKGSSQPEDVDGMMVDPERYRDSLLFYNGFLLALVNNGHRYDDLTLASMTEDHNYTDMLLCFLDLEKETSLLKTIDGVSNSYFDLDNGSSDAR